MNKRFLLLALGLVISTNAFAAHGGTHQAPDRVNRWDVGVGIAGAMNDETDNAPFVSTAVSYGVTPYIGLGVEAGWQEADSDTNNGTVGVVPVLFDIIFRCPDMHDALVPYAIVGLGGAGVYVQQDNLDDVDDTSFAWKLGAGADYFINPNWIFNVEIAMIDVDTELPGTSIDDGLDFWTIGVALKYVF